MIYCKINLDKSNYTIMDNAKILKDPDPVKLQHIYKTYCKKKKFPSVLPMFDSEFFDPSNDVIGYYDNDELVAFSLIRKYDKDNAEAIQFAWNYNNPKLRLGVNSLKHECALYKSLGYKNLYLFGADEYKTKIDGFEILPGIT